MKTFDENSVQVFSVLSNMCFVHFKLGERDMALTKIEEVLRIRKYNFEDDYEEVPTVYFILGVLHLNRGEIPIARLRFEDDLESFVLLVMGMITQLLRMHFVTLSLLDNTCAQHLTSLVNLSFWVFITVRCR